MGKITRGVPTNGRIANGAIVERELNFDFGSMETLKIALRNPDFTTAQRIAQAINGALGSGSARPRDPGTVDLAVPGQYREGSYALGCTRWQTVWNVVLRSAAPSLMTAVILGMTRAFGEALAVQMVIGNAIQMPTSLFTPASTLTSVLTMGMGNEAMGTVYNDVLWSLALLLLLMSLVFILIIHLIGHKGGTKRG